jgi:hypothetical protein
MKPTAVEGLDSGIATGLGLVERLIRLEISRLRATGVPAGQDEYRGLYISDEEVDQLLGAPAANQDAATAAALKAQLDQTRQELAGFAQSATGTLGRLIALAGLNGFETGCILIGLALDADLRFDRLFAYVQDDVTKRRPRVELALRLLMPTEQRVTAREHLAAEAPLRRLRLVTLHGEAGQPYTPLPAQTIALDARISSFLLGHTALDESLKSQATLLDQADTSLSLPEGLAQRLAELGRLPVTGLDQPIVLLSGRARAVRDAALVLGRGSNLPLLAVDFPGLVAAHGVDLALMLAEREAALQPAALLLQGLQRLKTEEAAQLQRRLEARPLAPLLLLGADGGFAWPGLNIDLPAPDFEARRSLWSQHLARLEPALTMAADGLAGKFELRASQIADAVQAARGNALWRSPAMPVVTVDDLYAAARSQSTPILSSLARKIMPRFGWDDIVLPADQIQQLREMGNHVEHHHMVYARWGLERRLGLSQGLMALFAGPSGTGKTMAADILARALGLDLYRIDLSGVVSKYIGETEKNLQHIFNEAETSNAILFFDEADALFGKRSEVKDAHDRYANIETAYLLQKMEEYAGVVILATNLKMNLDEAFMRRMHFVVDFPMPEEEDRRRIWASALPAEMPLGADVDLDFLARKFRLAGGHIRNIVVAAAFLAAADGRVVRMPHLIAATRREFQKIGRMVTPSDFENYYEQSQP